MNNTIKLPALITNALNQAYYEGSEMLLVEGSNITSYIHHELKVIMAYRNKSKKPYINSRYRITDEGFAEQVASHKRHLQNEANMNLAEQAEREELRSSLRVGDVFYISWGCEQTNIDFYQLVGAGKTFQFRQIKSQQIEDTDPETQTKTMVGRTIPLVGQFKDEEVHNKRFPRYGSFTINERFLHRLKYTVNEITGSRVYESKRYSSYA